MKRVIAYIDGFNFYHPIDDYYQETKNQGNAICLKWLDYPSLINSFLNFKTEKLIETKFFTTVCEDFGEDAKNRHLRYINALESIGVKIYHGKFLPKHQKCKVRGCTHPNKRYITREEKRTDVNIAVQLVKDSFEDNFDKAILLSADTDLIPAIQLVKEHRKEVIPACTMTKRNNCFVWSKSADIENAADGQFLEVKWNRLKRHLLSRTVGKWEMPKEYMSKEDFAK